jgi:hypothetical protein
MSTRELMEICERLPDADRAEVADFARFLLSKLDHNVPAKDAAERWLHRARGAAKPGITTDQIMSLTRGEP